jgi:hypothetical protein
MTGITQEIHGLIAQPGNPQPNAESHDGTGRGAGLPYGLEFSLDDVKDTLPRLRDKLQARVHGAYPFDAGIREHSVSWLALEGVSLDDARILEIARVIGASTHESWDRVTGGKQSETRHRLYMLGSAALQATELKGFDGNLMGTYISIEFDPLPKIS